VVKLNHAGVEYSEVGELMDGQHAVQNVDISVFETTETAPEWNVAMRHVIVEPAGESLHITEMLVVENPGDRTWLGGKQADGSRASVSLALPPNAEKVELGEAMREGFKSADGKLVQTTPLVPGMSQLQFAYALPLRDGKAQLTITAPAGVKHMMLFVPDTGQATAKGLEVMGSQDMGQGKMKVFKGSDLKAGHQAVLDVAVPVPAKNAGASLGTTPKIIAGVGGGLIVAIGTGIVLLKSPRTTKAH
jgi:hypothetical protein